MSKSVDSNVHWRSRGRVQLFCEDPSLTKQSFKDDCDVNFILRKFGHAAFIDPSMMPNNYGDFTDPLDYKAALDIILDSETLFSGLPSALRNRFENDPAQFLEFACNEENRQEMFDLGLLNEHYVPVGNPPVVEDLLDKNTPV
jgi:hypothetical protein